MGFKIQDLRPACRQGRFKIILLFISFFLLLAFPVFAQTQNVSVSVTVPPKASDFQFAYSSTDGLTTVSQGTTLSYQIIYGAKSSAQFDTTTVLEADFSDDLDPYGSHVLDYVPGSAGSAYGGAVPVVDLTNRKITWTIPNLPAGTMNQTVAFQLRTNSNYTGASSVNFTTRGKMSNQFVTMPDGTITQTYLYDPSIAPVPTVSPAPTSAVSNPTQAPTSGPVASITPYVTPKPAEFITPTGTNNPPKILSIDFTTLSATSAVISIVNSTAVKQTIFYGISPSTLLQKVDSNEYASVNSITLSNLKSNTQYYFKVISTDKNGNAQSSEIYTFRTAQVSSSPFEIEQGVVSIESLDHKVYSGIIDKNTVPGFVLLTDNTNFSFSYTPKNPVKYKPFEVIVRSKNTPDKIVTANLYRKNPYLFVSSMRSGAPGRYEIFLKAMDETGSVTEKKVADLKVSPHLRVFQKDKQIPLGDARVHIYFYNSTSGSYELVTKERFGNIKNPAYTDKNGEIDTLLPEGKYRAVVSAFLFDTKTQDFTLARGDGEDFPKIVLHKNPFNILALIRNIIDWIIDLIMQFQGLLVAYRGSIRSFNTVAASITMLSLISTLLFIFKTHMNPKQLPIFFMFNLHLLANKHIDKYIFGTVIGKDNLPLSKAIVQLVDVVTGEIIAHTTSNKNGRFHLQNIKGSNQLKLMVGKEGFREAEIVLGRENMGEEGVRIMLSAGSEPAPHASGTLKALEHVGGSFFEVVLFMSVVLELFFISSFGVGKTLPFFVLSLFNIILWIFFMREK